MSKTFIWFDLIWPLKSSSPLMAFSFSLSPHKLSLPCGKKFQGLVFLPPPPNCPVHKLSVSRGFQATGQFQFFLKCLSHALDYVSTNKLMIYFPEALGHIFYNTIDTHPLLWAILALRELLVCLNVSLKSDWWLMCIIGSHLLRDCEQGESDITGVSSGLSISHMA